MNLNTLKCSYKIKKMKKLCYCPAYFSGSEMYRLLDYDVLQNLVTRIEPSKIKLASNLLFGKKIISSEEQFLYILNKYIVFIKNEYFINANELIAIIEETLKSPYSDILFSHLDFNVGENPYMFRREFKKMFLKGLFENFKIFFCNKNAEHQLCYLRDFSLDNEKQLDELYSIFKSIINLRRNNLYNFFDRELANNQDDDIRKNLCYKQWNDAINKYIASKEYLEKIGL